MSPVLDMPIATHTSGADLCARAGCGHRRDEHGELPESDCYHFHRNKNCWCMCKEFVERHAGGAE